MNGPSRTCSKCHEHKPLTEFYLNRSCRLGHARTCKICDKAKHAKERYADVRRDAKLVRVTVAGWGARC